MKVVDRKVKKLCHGVYVIFTFIEIPIFGLNMVRIYISELQKNYIIFLS